MEQLVEPKPRRLNPRAIMAGVAIGIAGIPLAYVLMRAAGLIISDPLLLVCAAAPTVILLALALAPRLRGWAIQAAIASAIASVLLVLTLGGGIALIANLLSDPRP